jgi:hypothetical protein
MPHVCSSECVCRIDLDAAVATLNTSSKALLDSILYGSDELIETRYAGLKVAWARVSGAHSAYRDHFTEV